MIMMDEYCCATWSKQLRYKGLNFDVPNMKFKPYLVMLWLLLYSVHLHCQHPNLFDYSISSSYLNPSSAAIDGKSKVYFSRHRLKLMQVLNYSSILAGGEFHIPMTHKSHAASTVLLHFTDASLNFSDGIKTQAITGGYAHYLKPDKASGLSAAIHVSYQMQHFTMKGFSTGSQYYEGEGYIASLPLNEPVENYRGNWFSVGTSFSYHRQLAGEKNIRLGFSGFNLNRPESSARKAGERLPRNYYARASCYLPVIAKKIFLQPQADIFYNGNALFRFGSSAMVCLPDSKDGFDGFSVQTMHCAKRFTTMGVKVHHQKLKVGINHSFYHRQVPFVGATEIVFAYMFDKKNNVKTANAATNQPQPRNFYQFDEKETPSVTPVKNQKKPVHFQLSRYVDFEFNSSGLNREAEMYLDELVTILNSDSDLKIEVMGHTDNVGTKEANEKVSLQRAKAVASYITDLGISAQRVNIIGFGADRPLTKNRSDDQRAQNRRVDIRIYK